MVRFVIVEFLELFSFGRVDRLLLMIERERRFVNIVWVEKYGDLIEVDYFLINSIEIIGYIDVKV